MTVRCRSSFATCRVRAIAARCTLKVPAFWFHPTALVLTNAHVVDGAKEVTVKLSDHREYKAKVLGADRSSDIAVLKIDAHDLPSGAARRFQTDWASVITCSPSASPSAWRRRRRPES